MGTKVLPNKRAVALRGLASLAVATATALSAGLVAIPAASAAPTATIASGTSAAAPSAVLAKPSADPSLESTDLGALPQRQQVLSNLRSEAEDEGSVRVLVTFATEFEALGAQSSADATDQRAEVRSISDRVRSLAVSRGASVNRTYGGNIPAIALTVTPAALDALADSASVAKIDPDAAEAPLDTATNQVINADDAQAAGYHGAGSGVAILDTGVEFGHQAFGTRVTNTACFSATSSCPNGQPEQVGGNAGVPCTYAASECRHGTHVAGIAGGAGSVPGVADQTRITAIQVFSQLDCAGTPCARSYPSDQIAALNWAYTNRSIGFRAVNMSLGGGQYQSNCDSQESARKTAIDNLRSVGIATVIASGNSSYTDAVGAPGCISTAITVGATNNSDQVANFSNSGQLVDLYAPGVGVNSSVPGNTYASFNGTSMATPQVAGAIATMTGANSALTVAQIETTLGSTGPLVTDSKSGLTRRRLDVAAAVGLGSQPTPTVLANDVVQEFDTPPSTGQVFETRSTNGYWSAVAIRPPFSGDYDLDVFDDAQRSSLLGRSTGGGSTIDFVAQDNNSGRRAVGDDTYPSVRPYNNATGRYQIEYANDVRVLSDGSQTVSMGSSEIIEIRDSFQQAGLATYYRVVPSTSSQDAELHLMESTAGTPSTYMRPRSAAVSSSTVGGPGAAESFSYTSSASQYDGLVLINKVGSGDYTLYRDTSAPLVNGMVINEGATRTTSRDVTLSLDASDTQTGLMDMRVSVDGVLDSEGWEPYATSKAVTLPAGDGEKTVLVQVRNNAGMESEPFSDTITLATPTAPAGPSVTSSTPSAGAITVAFSPNSDGGSTITSYQAVCGSTNGGATGTATGTTSPIKVQNLTGSKTYRCRVRATNAVGTGPYGAFGTDVVLPAPAVAPGPTVRSSTPSAGAVTIAFTPNGDGGSPITSYQAVCGSTNGGVTASATGTTSPIKVSGLSGSKTYRCRVRATNAVGTGPYGAFGTDVVLPAPTVAPAPTVRSSTPSTGAVTVAFTSNGDGGSPITSYFTVCGSTNGGATGSTSGTTSPLRVTGLTSGKTYRCRVRATNAVGTSTYSAFGTDVTVP